MNIRVIFVDWANTLSTSLFWQHRTGSCLSAADSARVESYVFSRAEILRQWMVGAVSAEEVCASAAACLGLPAADLLADLEDSCRSMEFDDPAAIDVLQAIREQGIKVVLATDNMDTFHRWTVPAMHLTGVADDILDSASLGCLKGDLAGSHSPFFGPWLSQRRIAPSEAILVDDSPTAAAAAIGLHARRVEHPGKLASILTELWLAAACTGASPTTPEGRTA
jgi:FMN phosphatase YigB (HAD superfamily)